MSPSSRIGEFPLVSGEEVHIVVARLDERTKVIEEKVDRIADAVLGPDDAQHKGLSHRVTNLETQSKAHRQTVGNVKKLLWGLALTVCIYLGDRLWNYVTHLHAPTQDNTWQPTTSIPTLATT